MIVSYSNKFSLLRLRDTSLEIPKEMLVTLISSLCSMILALINDWSWRSRGWSHPMHTFESPETTLVVLRTITIAVYFFLFEQKIFLLYFYHIKYFENMNWVFVDYWFSTLAWTPTCEGVSHHLYAEDRHRTAILAVHAKEAKDTLHVWAKLLVKSPGKSVRNKLIWAKEEGKQPFAYIVATSCI